MNLDLDVVREAIDSLQNDGYITESFSVESINDLNSKTKISYQISNICKLQIRKLFVEESKTQRLGDERTEEVKDQN